MRIDVIIDPVCPWCYIGKRRLEKALSMRPSIDADIRWRPFLLNPDIPNEGIDREAYLIGKYGSESKVRRILNSIAEEGHSVKIDFNLGNLKRTPCSVDAHRLIRYAERFDKADLVVEELFSSYLVKALDIGDIKVLTDIGRNIGLKVRALRRYLKSDEGITSVFNENTRSHRLGINGVPVFMFNRKMVISGAHEAPILAKMMDAANVR